MSHRAWPLSNEEVWNVLVYSAHGKNPWAQVTKEISQRRTTLKTKITVILTESLLCVKVN